MKLLVPRLPPPGMVTVVAEMLELEAANARTPKGRRSNHEAAEESLEIALLHRNTHFPEGKFFGCCVRENVIQGLGLEESHPHGARVRTQGGACTRSTG